MSYGVNDMRDGVNLSRMQVTRPLVMHTEVTNLPNLCGYLRFGRNLPVVQFQDSYNRVPSVCVAFEERLAPPVRMAIDPVASPEQAAEPEPASRRPPSRRRRAQAEEAPAELPLAPPASPDEAPDAPIPEETSASPTNSPTDSADPATVPPQLTLYGRATAFRLRQHGRRDGDRNAADPA